MELQNYVLHYYLGMLIILINMSLYQSAVSTYSFGKLNFRIFLFSMFSVYAIFHANFDAIFIGLKTFV